ncbi:MAG: hypothetical protein ACRD3W_21145, partial [Terriglobales bacterium]
FGTQASVVDCTSLKPWPENMSHGGRGFEIETEVDEALFRWLFQDGLELTSAGEQTFDGHSCRGWRWRFKDIQGCANEQVWWFDKVIGCLVRRRDSAKRFIIVPTSSFIETHEIQLDQFIPKFQCPKQLEGERVYPHSITYKPNGARTFRNASEAREFYRSRASQSQSNHSDTKPIEPDHASMGEKP